MTIKFVQSTPHVVCLYIVPDNLFAPCCYFLQVTALLSLPALDLAAAISLLPQRRHFQRGDLVFIENYKAARLAAQAALQSLPVVALSAVLLGLKAAGGVAAQELGRVPYALLAVAMAASLVNVGQRLGQLWWQKQVGATGVCARFGCTAWCSRLFYILLHFLRLCCSCPELLNAESCHQDNDNLTFLISCKADMVHC